MNELYAALAKAQSKIETAKKDNFNPHFKSKYADLSNVWDACREALTENGLAVVQIPSAKGPEVTVKTILGHVSGSEISGELTMIAQKNTPQGIGSAITYCRRYALMSFVGIAPDDDDGNDASMPSYPQQHQHQQQRQKPVRQQPVQIESPLKGELKKAMDESNGLWGEGDIKRLLYTKYKVTWPPHKDEQWQELIDAVKSGVAPEEMEK